MRPVLSRTEDKGTLQDLGRASIQIVHDIKNQLNGLKLYATFLRRRLEKSERPDDEHETISKLISGLDRAANDLSTILEYGRTIELKEQPGFDIQKVLRGICSGLEAANFKVEPGTPLMVGEFDPTRMTDALKWISVGAAKYVSTDDEVSPLLVALKLDSETNQAEIEWSGLAKLDHDPFLSFAGTDEIRMSLAGKIVKAHRGTVLFADDRIVVKLPLQDQNG